MFSRHPPSLVLFRHARSCLVIRPRLGCQLLAPPSRDSRRPVLHTQARAQESLARSAGKLQTLESLTPLPPGEWHFHVGDVPHGESPTLDDSSWPLVAPNSKAPKEAVWYRREIEVPKTLNGYDITGSRIWFQFQADANGPMPQIIYFNGRSVALGDDLEPIVLFAPAKAR